MTIIQLKSAIRDRVAEITGNKAIGVQSIGIIHLLQSIQKIDSKNVWKIETKKDPHTKKNVFVLSSRVERLTIEPFHSLEVATERVLAKILNLLNITK